MKVLLGVTGSVAATLTKKLVDALQEAGHEVRVVMTRASEYFVPRKCLYVPVYDETHEWPNERYERGEEITHIMLRDWADVLVIAPLTANTLSKITRGIADNLLTTIFLAWDPKKPIIVAPAMNTKMWQHPMVRANCALIGYMLKIIDPVEKKLACGEQGLGAMAPISEIVSQVSSCEA